MIYELRTYNCMPGTVPELLKRVGQSYEHRAKYSEMAGFWYTDIGPLHQVVHLWPYESPDERLRIRTEAAKNPHWPPDTAEFIIDMQSEIYMPAPFSPELKTGRLGPVYEMRSYTIRPLCFPEVVKRWEAALAERLALSPMLIALFSENGPLNKFVHVWPYESLQHRAETRAKAEATGVWPPKGSRQFSTRQENKILLPAPFSPLQ